MGSWCSEQSSGQNGLPAVAVVAVVVAAAVAVVVVFVGLFVPQVVAVVAAEVQDLQGILCSDSLYKKFAVVMKMECKTWKSNK